MTWQSDGERETDILEDNLDKQYQEPYCKGKDGRVEYTSKSFE